MDGSRFQTALVALLPTVVALLGIIASYFVGKKQTESSTIKNLWDECHRLREEVETTRVSYNALLARIAPLEGLKERYEQVKEENAELKNRVKNLEEANRNYEEDKRLLKECEKCTADLREELRRVKDDNLERVAVNESLMNQNKILETEITQLLETRELKKSVEANSQRINEHEMEERL